MPLAKVHQLFEMLKLSYAFVVHAGQLQGVVTRLDLVRFSKERYQRGMFL
jgi:hypothetical protein